MVPRFQPFDHRGFPESFSGNFIVDKLAASGMLFFADRGSSKSAEDGGFEPPRAFTQHAFQACAIGH